MLWSKTLFAFVFCGTLAVSGCGFSPLYADKTADESAAGALSVSRSNIQIANIPNRNGQFLRNELIDRLYLKGRPAAAPFTLTVTNLSDVTTNLGIRRDATATRAMYEMDAAMVLTNSASGKVLLQRNVRAVGGYNELNNQLATLVSRQNLQDNMLQELADTIVRQLDLYFTRAPKADVTNVDTVTPLHPPSPLVPTGMQNTQPMSAP